MAVYSVSKCYSDIKIFNPFTSTVVTPELGVPLVIRGFSDVEVRFDDKRATAIISIQPSPEQLRELANALAVSGFVDVELMRRLVVGADL